MDYFDLIYSKSEKEYWHLLEEFLQLQALQSENEPALPAHTTLSFLDLHQVQVGQIHNLQPGYLECYNMNQPKLRKPTKQMWLNLYII